VRVSVVIIPDCYPHQRVIKISTHNLISMVTQMLQRKGHAGLKRSQNKELSLSEIQLLLDQGLHGTDVRTPK